MYCSIYHYLVVLVNRWLYPGTATQRYVCRGKWRFIDPKWTFFRPNSLRDRYLNCGVATAIYLAKMNFSAQIRYAIGTR